MNKSECKKSVAENVTEALDAYSITEKNFGKNKVVFLSLGKDFSEENICLKRYMKYSYFVTGCLNSSFYFSDFTNWKDPCEKRFLAKELNNKKQFFELPFVKPCCFAIPTSDAEEALWSVNRGQDDAEMVCIYIRLEKFLKELCKNLVEDVTVYVSQVKYQDSLKRFSKTVAEQYLMNTTNESLTQKWIKLLSLKRNAFRYENEVRIFLVSDKEFDCDNSGNFKVCNIKYKSFVKEVVLKPFAPDFVEETSDSVRKILTESQKKELKKCLGEAFSGVIKKSRLYEL